MMQKCGFQLFTCVCIVYYVNVYVHVVEATLNWISINLIMDGCWKSHKGSEWPKFWTLKVQMSILANVVTKLKPVRDQHSRDLKQCTITILQEMEYLFDKGTTFRTAMDVANYSIANTIVGHT